ncbi:hypothetical protein FTV94_15665 [Escherichia coli]|nr:hypothetical protein FTV94_15665 [Escherichia coli]
MQSPAHVRFAPPHAVCGWTAVGCLKARRNQSRVAGENTSGRSDEGSGLSAINAIPREYHAGCVE